MLSDPKKKQMYDSGQMDYDGDQGSGMGDFDPNDVFRMFFGGGMGGGGMGSSGFKTSGGRGGQSYTFRFG